MRVVFLGSDFWGLYFLRRLVKYSDVAGIVAASGSLGLLDEGKKLNVPCYPIQNRKDRGYQALLKTLRPDLIVSAGFPQILKQYVLDIPPLGTINIHGSYLPACGKQAFSDQPSAETQIEIAFGRMGVG